MGRFSDLKDDEKEKKKIRIKFWEKHEKQIRALLRELNEDLYENKGTISKNRSDFIFFGDYQVTTPCVGLRTRDSSYTVKYVVYLDPEKESFRLNFKCSYIEWCVANISPDGLEGGLKHAVSGVQKKVRSRLGT